ncbi:protein kinase domain-containing protein, partial [Actinoallomurus acaciae]
MKPADIVLSPTGPRLIDFGIARQVGHTGGPTGPGMVVGSPGWIPPERLEHLPPTPAFDVFGWGCVVGYAATGRGGPDVIAQLSMSDPPDLDGLDDSLRGPVAKSLSRSPAGRPSTGPAPRTIPYARRPPVRRPGLDDSPRGPVTQALSKSPTGRPASAEPTTWPDQPDAAHEPVRETPTRTATRAGRLATRTGDPDPQQVPNRTPGPAEPTTWPDQPDAVHEPVRETPTRTTASGPDLPHTGDLDLFPPGASSPQVAPGRRPGCALAGTSFGVRAGRGGRHGDGGARDDRHRPRQARPRGA